MTSPDIAKVPSRVPGRVPAELYGAMELIASRPHGISDRALLSTLPTLSTRSIDQCIATGWIERSPIHGGWLRWAQPTGPFPGAAACVRLRRRAGFALAKIHALSGLPTTLHVLVPEGHAVIERYPGEDVASIAAETVRYEHPRSLSSGITSMVFLAFLPEPTRTRQRGISTSVEIESQRKSILELGYGYSRTAKPATDAVLSAAVVPQGGLPICALCTYGSADILSQSRASEIGHTMTGIAVNLAVKASRDWTILQEPARGLIFRDL
jgi:DNA-binding IclR family transcriptional regulator